MRLLIKGARLIDGTGKPSRQSDILVVGDRITAIGKLNARIADETLDGTGAIVMPGFIDPCSEADRNFSLLKTPTQESYLLQGVTTAIGGHGGISLAPHAHEASRELARAGTGVNADWRTITEFYATMRRLSLGINFGTCVGEASMSRYVVSLRPRNEAERASLERQVEDEALRQGAFGFSKSASSALAARQHKKAEGQAELPLLAIEVASSMNARNADALARAIEKCPTQRVFLTGLRPHSESSDVFAKLINKTGRHRAEKDVRFELVPSETRMYRVSDIASQMKNEIAEKGIGKRSRIVGASRHAWLEGVAFGEFAKSRELTAERALARLAELEPEAEIEGGGVDEVAFEHALLHPRALVSAGKYSRPETPVFLEFIRRASAKLALEQVVERITSIPASFMGIRDRGVVREGAYADLVLLKDGAVDAVLVNGRVALRGGKFLGVRAGRCIKREPAR